MALPNWKYYVENNDFEGAMERLNNAYKNWKEHWFVVCKTIYNKCEELKRKYFLDPIKYTVTLWEELITKTGTKNPTDGSYTYLKRLFSEGKQVFTKIGKTSRKGKRDKELGSKEYKRANVIIDKTEDIVVYELPDDDLAQVLENIMRRYFRTKYTFVPNDRFEPFEPDEEDLGVFSKYYELVRVM